jgi:hypothetical protein
MNQPFSVTARAWQEAPLEKGVLIHSLSDLLQAQLTLSDYGTGVVEFNFTAILEPVEFFPTKYQYTKHSKRIDAEMRMDYDQAVHANMDTFKALLAQLYLHTVDLLEKEKIPDFDLPRFKADLEDFFAHQGWLVSV